jgi:hypothetical protein
LSARANRSSTAKEYKAFFMVAPVEDVCVLPIAAPWGSTQKVAQAASSKQDTLNDY